MFVPHASEIWTKSYGPNKILSFLTKNQGFFKPFYGIFEDVSAAETNF